LSLHNAYVQARSYNTHRVYGTSSHAENLSYLRSAAISVVRTTRNAAMPKNLASVLRSR
jgi:hypothetical protein